MYYAFTPNSIFKSSSASWLRTYLTNQYVILRYCSPNLCKWNYLYSGLPFFKIQVNHFMAQDKPFGAKIIPKCILWVRGLVPFWVLRHSFLSLTDCWCCCRLFSHVQPSATPWTAAFQAPPSMGFSRQEYWSGVPLLMKERNVLKFRMAPGPSPVRCILG